MCGFQEASTMTFHSVELIADEDAKLTRQHSGDR
jgi:hypothetical protein